MLRFWPSALSQRRTLLLTFSEGCLRTLGCFALALQGQVAGSVAEPIDLSTDIVSLVARSGPRSVVLDSVRNLGVRQAPEPGQMITFTTEIPLAVGGWKVGVALEQAADSAGEVLRDLMTQHPDRHMTVLCGHTHSAGRVQVLSNLEVLTGAAEYGQPAIQKILTVP
jgi:hypothetical protein